MIGHIAQTSAPAQPPSLRPPVTWLFTSHHSAAPPSPLRQGLAPYVVEYQLLICAMLSHQNVLVCVCACACVKEPALLDVASTKRFALLFLLPLRSLHFASPAKNSNTRVLRKRTLVILRYCMSFRRCVQRMFTMELFLAIGIQSGAASMLLSYKTKEKFCTRPAK